MGARSQDVGGQQGEHQPPDQYAARAGGPPPDRGHESLPQGGALRDEVKIKQESTRGNGGDVSQEVRKK